MDEVYVWTFSFLPYLPSGRECCSSLNLPIDGTHSYLNGPRPHEKKISTEKQQNLYGFLLLSFFDGNRILCLFPVSETDSYGTAKLVCVCAYSLGHVWWVLWPTGGELDNQQLVYAQYHRIILDLPWCYWVFASLLLCQNLHPLPPPLCHVSVAYFSGSAHKPVIEVLYIWMLLTKHE